MLTSSVAFPMNFALFHQVIVAGGLDPELRHSSTAMRDTEKGSVGGVMVTVCGKTEKYRNEKNIKLSKLCITAKRILERRGIQTSSLNHLIVKI